MPRLRRGIVNYMFALILSLGDIKYDHQTASKILSINKRPHNYIRNGKLMEVSVEKKN